MGQAWFPSFQIFEAVGWDFPVEFLEKFALKN